MRHDNIVTLFVPLFVLGWAGTQSPLPAAPVASPIIFAPGTISTGGYESHPAFMPDGRTVYFVKSTPSFSFWTICVSRFERGRWSAPEVAPFSGAYADADPFITPDGAHLYFISTRPLSGSGPAKDLDIWVVDRTEKRWSDPKRLPEPINSSGAEWFPTLAANGNLYFGSDRAGGLGRTDLYRARLTDGRYAAAENLGAPINTAANEFEPLIAPDERYLIFMGGGRPGGAGGWDLWIAYSQNGSWTAPVPLGGGVNSPANEYSPAMSPDGRLFFWASARETFDTGGRRLSYRQLEERLSSPGNGLGDIYVMDVSALHLEATTPKAPAPPLQQTAGEKYKSVQVLRSIPADQIIPTMAFIANSLGVTCAHCHGTEWESDEKPAKQKAREMIQLTETINRNNFAGRQIVTCQTCHDGRVVPAATPRVEDAGWTKKPPAPAPALPDVADVFEAYVRGAGGEAALTALKSRRVTGTVTRFNGRSEPVSRPFELLQQGTSVSLKTDLSHPPEGDAEVNASFVRPLYTARSYTDVKVTGIDRVRGRDVVVVTGRNQRGIEHRLFFDRQNGLLLRRSDEIATPLGALPEQYDLDDYRAVDGVMVPHLMQWSRADYQVTFRIDTVRHNVAPPVMAPARSRQP